MSKRGLFIDEKEAIKLYDKAPQWLKTMLVETFGKETFNQPITERVKSIEDAFDVTGRPVINDLSIFPEDVRDYMKAQYEAVVLAEALNQGEILDYENGDQRKWLPWYDFSGGGFVFDGTDYCYSDANAGRASRLCLQSDELATYAGKNFPELYKTILNR